MPSFLTYLYCWRNTFQNFLFLSQRALHGDRADADDDDPAGPLPARGRGDDPARHVRRPGPAQGHRRVHRAQDLRGRCEIRGFKSNAV